MCPFFLEKKMIKKSRLDIFKQVYEGTYSKQCNGFYQGTSFIMLYDDLNDRKFDLIEASPYHNTKRYALAISITIIIIELAKGNEVTIIDNYNPEKTYDRIGYIKKIISRHKSWYRDWETVAFWVDFNCCDCVNSVFAVYPFGVYPVIKYIRLICFYA